MERNESAFVDQLEEVFKNNGFMTFREVIPDDCEGWGKPYRVDLIIYRNDLGYIGIEAKHINTLGQGSIIAEAFEQVKKYKPYTYFKGNIISRWCIAPFYDEKSFSDNDRTLAFIQNFLRYYHISFLILKKYPNRPEWDRISIDALTTGSLSFRRNPFKEGGDNDQGIPTV